MPFITLSISLFRHMSRTIATFFASPKANGSEGPFRSTKPLHVSWSFMKNAVCPLEFEALARRNKKEWLLEFSPRKARKPRKVVWFVPPRSRRSRCSRFIEFKRSVRCNPNRESFYGLFFLVRTLRVVRGSGNSKGVSVVDSNRERREIREHKREWPQ